MKLGYMTNGFGPLVGDGGGVTSVKDIRYLTICDDEAVLKEITDVGFRYIEVLEGNLTKYAGDIQVLKDMLARYHAGMMSVCVGANFIYKDALEDEMYHMKTVASLAQKVGVSYVGFCGGAIRGKGIQDGDYKLLAEGLDEAGKIFADYGIEASYHPHLGSMAEHPDQIDKLFALTDIKICPDLAHLAAGGGDPLEIVKKYYDRISFVHLKDLDADGFAPLGTGSIDIEGVLGFLKEKGYAGDYLVEVDGYAGDPRKACEISYGYLKGKL
ncbi:sugar phosphate isomerase/epimerase [Blautia schinkii]|nr:sugar phosphate isomerase/epimerase [Blautia schinkii]